jgi:hypothetical protein
MVKDERYILESFYDLHFICLWKRFELNAKCLFLILLNCILKLHTFVDFTMIAGNFGKEFPGHSVKEYWKEVK